MKSLATFFAFATASSPLAKLQKNARAIIDENEELMKMNRRFRSQLECGKLGTNVLCRPEPPREPAIYSISCEDGGAEDIIETFKVDEAGTYQITVNTSGKNLFVGLYLNEELVTYADRRPQEMLTSEENVSVSLTWLGSLTTDDTISLRNLEDHFETVDGVLTSEQFSVVSCSDFQMVVNELTTNSY